MKAKKNPTTETASDWLVREKVVKEVFGASSSARFEVSER